jgi:transposase InsO family protein
MPNGVPPFSVLGGLALLLCEWCPAIAERLGSVDETLKRIGGSRSQAFEMRKRLKTFFPPTLGKAGRPSRQAVEKDPVKAVMEACFNYLVHHPGSICAKEDRNSYSEGYRRFIIKLAGPNGPAKDVPLVDLAYASQVPEGTLKSWLYPQPPGPGKGSNKEQHPEQQGKAAEESTKPPSSGEQAAQEHPAVSETVKDVHLRQLFNLWSNWNGTFVDFCQMAIKQHRLPFTMTFIGDALEAAGLRTRSRRKKEQAPWTAGTFRSYFPGAQWLGDGTSIAVRYLGQVFVFNVEYLHDVASDAGMGFHISDAEDEQALIEAFESGVETAAGVLPLALTMDNRPSNHTPEVKEALGETLLLRSTPGRPQSKAPIEGAFGLFQQSMPPLHLQGTSARDVARSYLHTVMAAWFRGRNGRPRKRNGGLSPNQAYFAKAPTPEEVQKAMAALRERQKRQEKAMQTLQDKRDPVRLQLLAEGLAELGIADPNGSLATTLARYSREAIVYGLATFRTKKAQGTLPPGADHRYLAGIIRNDHEKRHLLEFSEHLFQQRVRLHDFSLAPLARLAARIRATKASSELPQSFVSLALEAEFEIDFRYWAQAAGDALAALPRQQRPPLYQHLCRLIAGAFKTQQKRRETLVDRLATAATLAAA